MLKIFLYVLLEITKIIKHKTKYIAAYLTKNAKPRNIPNKRKFNLDGKSLIFKRTNKQSDQKKINKTSVEIKKDETLTAGIR